MCVCMSACVLSRLNPSASLISSYPPHPTVPTPGFSFNEMFGSLHSPYSLSFYFYPFSFLQLIVCLSSLHCLWVFISHLAWKGNKRSDILREPCSALSFCSPAPFFLSFIFVCGGRPYQGDGRAISPVWRFVVK